MAVYFRRDDDVQNGLGQAMPNIAVTYYVQPGLTLASVFSDSAGTASTNPQLTNGLGQTAAYLAAGLYTITYSGAQIQTLTYPDQLVSSGGSGGGTTHATVTPAPDGTTRIFTLSISSSAVPADDQFFVAGSFVPYGTNYTVAATTITWTGPVAPQEGDSLDYYVA